MSFAATLNPVVYEDGIPVFIDTERDSWNMDPVALEKAFELYPEVKLVVCAELYQKSSILTFFSKHPDKTLLKKTI